MKNSEMVDFTIIDIETTGLSPAKNEIIELSAIKIRNNEIVENFTELVKPNDIEKLSKKITKLTGITKDMLQNADNIKNVLPKFLDFIGDDIIMGYNVNFDISFIRFFCLDCLKKDFKNGKVDLLPVARKKLDLDNHKLVTVAEFFEINTENNHRGLKDCQITFEVYKNLNGLGAQIEVVKNKNNQKDFKKEVPKNNVENSSVLEDKLEKIFIEKYGKKIYKVKDLEIQLFITSLVFGVIFLIFKKEFLLYISVSCFTTLLFNLMFHGLNISINYLKKFKK